MKKKCLACGNTFAGEISICQTCFKVIEQARSQVDALPRGFRKKAYLNLRIFNLAMALVLIVLSISMASLISLILAPFVQYIMKLKVNHALFLMAMFLPMVIFLIIGLGAGTLLQKTITKKLIKQWSDLNWYREPARRWRNAKYWLPTILPIFILGLFLWIVFSVLQPIIFNLQIKSELVLCLLISLVFGLRFFWDGFLIGLVLTGYHSLDWVGKLSR